jgi:hypothetical protein
LQVRSRHVAFLELRVDLCLQQQRTQFRGVGNQYAARQRDGWNWKRQWH